MATNPQIQQVYTKNQDPLAPENFGTAPIYVPDPQTALGQQFIEQRRAQYNHPWVRTLRGLAGGALMAAGLANQAGRGMTLPAIIGGLAGGLGGYGINKLTTRYGDRAASIQDQRAQANNLELMQTSNQEIQQANEMARAMGLQDTPDVLTPEYPDTSGLVSLDQLHEKLKQQKAIQDMLQQRFFNYAGKRDSMNQGDIPLNPLGYTPGAQDAYKNLQNQPGQTSQPQPQQPYYRDPSLDYSDGSMTPQQPPLIAGTGEWSMGNVYNVPWEAPYQNRAELTNAQINTVKAPVDIRNENAKTLDIQMKRPGEIANTNAQTEKYKAETRFYDRSEQPRLDKIQAEINELKQPEPNKTTPSLQTSIMQSVQDGNISQAAAAVAMGQSATGGKVWLPTPNSGLPKGLDVNTLVPVSVTYQGKKMQALKDPATGKIYTTDVRSPFEAPAKRATKTKRSNPVWGQSNAGT